VCETLASLQQWRNIAIIVGGASTRLSTRLSTSESTTIALPMLMAVRRKLGS
jgi:2-phospho-L-lactate guanylyltransferase (CobY/MobA/RfbA family)